GSAFSAARENIPPGAEQAFRRQRQGESLVRGGSVSREQAAFDGCGVSAGCREAGSRRDAGGRSGCEDRDADVVVAAAFGGKYSGGKDSAVGPGGEQLEEVPGILGQALDGGG